jgi:hypothetical protein
MNLVTSICIWVDFQMNGNISSYTSNIQATVPLYFNLYLGDFKVEVHDGSVLL